MNRAVCALIVDKNNKILSVSRKDDHDDWGLPGGKLDSGENFESAVIRESLEETGYHIRISPDFPYFEDIDNNFLVRTYLCEITSRGKLKVSDQETGLVEYKDSEDILRGSFGDYNLKCLAHFNSVVHYKPKDINYNGMDELC